MGLHQWFLNVTVHAGQCRKATGHIFQLGHGKFLRPHGLSHSIGISHHLHGLLDHLWIAPHLSQFGITVEELLELWIGLKCHLHSSLHQIGIVHETLHHGMVHGL